MNQIFVSCPHGFESLLEQELFALGVRAIEPKFCGVSIPKSVENVFTTNYLSRIATRVLWPLASFPCRGKEDLYARCKRISWSFLLSAHKTFAVDGNIQHPAFPNTLFPCLIVKDAICDFFREKTGNRPSVDTKFPDVQLNLFIQKGQATLYLDTSGAPLHKRGWRETNTEATLHESLAAALLMAAGYDGSQILCDPFCGSGTFLIEAALIATQTPPGFLRKKWGFFPLQGMSKELFLEWKKPIDAHRRSLPSGKIFGSDKSRENAEIAQKHLQKVGLLSSIRVDYQEVAYYNPPQAPNMIVSNPPYGKRLETSLQIFQELGQFCKNKASSSAEIFLLTPELSIVQDAGFSLDPCITFKTGGLPVQFSQVKLA